LVGNPERYDHLEDLGVNNGRVMPEWIFMDQNGRSWDEFNWLRAGADSRSEGKPEGNRPLGKPRRRREDNIKIYV
jgi:hypothetical protein